MEFANLLAKASRIAAEVYAGLPASQKQHALYRKFTGEAMTWLKYRWKETDVLEWLQQRYSPGKIDLFCRQQDELQVAGQAPATEEQAIARFKVRLNRRLLRLLRRGDYSIMEDHPPASPANLSTKNKKAPHRNAGRH